MKYVDASYRFIAGAALVLFVVWPMVTVASVEADRQPEDATVNERVPAQREAREAYWGIDCDAAVAQLRVLLAASAPDDEVRGEDSRKYLAATDLFRDLSGIEKTLVLCAHIDRLEKNETDTHMRLAAGVKELLSCLEQEQEDCESLLRKMRLFLQALDVNQGQER